jgi:hypothetical protein
MRRLCISAAVAMVLVTASRAPAARVLWDTSHGIPDFGDYRPEGLFSELSSMLGGAGFTVEPTSRGFLADDPAGYDALVVTVVSSWNSAYTPAEVDRILSFVRGGGGLLLMADNAETRNGNIAPVAAALGVNIGLSTVSPGDTSTSDLTGHPIFQNVDEIYMRVAGNISGGTIVARQEGTGLGLVSVLTPGAGRVVVFGDSNSFENNYFPLADNHAWALSTFGWLVPEPSAAALLSMTLGTALLARRRRATRTPSRT